MQQQKQTNGKIASSGLCYDIDSERMSCVLVDANQNTKNREDWWLTWRIDDPFCAATAVSLALVAVDVDSNNHGSMTKEQLGVFQQVFYKNAKKYNTKAKAVVALVHLVKYHFPAKYPGYCKEFHACQGNA